MLWPQNIYVNGQAFMKLMEQKSERTIVLDYATFMHFYKLLVTNIAIKMYGTDNPFKKSILKTTEIWNEKNGILPVQAVTNGLATARDYFYKRKSTGKKTNAVDIDVLCFINSLKYMDFNNPNSWAKMEPYSQAKVQREHLKLLAELEAGDNKEGDEMNSKRKDQIKKLVEQYYTSLAERKFDIAWSLLSPEYKQRDICDGDFEKFKACYTNTRNIFNIHVFNVTEYSSSRASCLVYYEDEVALYPLPELDSMKNLKIENINEFVFLLEKFKESMKSKGGKFVEQLKLEKIFDPLAIENVWYDCEFDPKNLRKTFGFPESKFIRRMYDMSCILVNDKWLIDNISFNQILTYTAR